MKPFRRNASSRSLALPALAILAILVPGNAPVWAQGSQPTTTRFIPVPETSYPRLTVFISDLHFGLGRLANGRWSPKEDFRWTKALEGFLAEISRQGNDRVDLVIVGDFLELWQPPAGVLCKGDGADRGCTPAEMVTTVNAVVSAHAGDLALLRNFVWRGENRLHIIPGNHDSALMLPEVWAPVALALGEADGHVALVTQGVWTSFDGQIVAEHGHQVGTDVNRYSAWPRVTVNRNGTTYLERPWGEKFVQDVFNAEEEDYEIIDNIAPETVGVKYRIADRGLARTAADTARFIAFNFLETSAKQKWDALGKEGKADDRVWNTRIARDEIGVDLFIKTLDEEDTLRKELIGGDEISQAVREQLLLLVQDSNRLSDDDVRALCDELAARKADKQCSISSAGSMLEARFVPRQHVLRSHIAGHLQRDPRLSIFVYGHTHALEIGWQLNMAPGQSIAVHNTGAFQRTVDEQGFLSRVSRRKLSASEALRAIKLEELAPCYSAVIVKYVSGLPTSKTWRWHMEETGSGSLVEPGDARCE
jgi:UDP-2,3-diacylglucosamine pyrophosphatase LpxH